MERMISQILEIVKGKCVPSHQSTKDGAGH